MMRKEDCIGMCDRVLCGRAEEREVIMGYV